jgi:hypothetical protein
MSIGSAVTSCVILNRKSLWGYRGDENVPFIKITCSDAKALPKVKDRFNGILVSNADLQYGPSNEDRSTSMGSSPRRSSLTRAT